MKLRAITLGSAALATLLFAGPAFAQQSVYDTNPTPQERAQTDQLNGQAAAQAHGDADANAADRSNYQAARAQYERDRAMSDAERAAYERDLSRYHNDQNAYIHRWDAFYGYSRFRDVMDVPSRDLVGLDVSTRGGNRIGRIRDVDTSPSGRILRVSVGTGHGEATWIDADNLRFDPSARVVLTDLTRDEIDGMAHMRYPRF